MDYWKAGGPGLLTRVAASRLVELLHPVLPPVTYMTVGMMLRLGYWPHIANPRSFNEKIVHRQLFAPHPLASILADKWRVRQYVAERVSEDILNEVCFVTDDPERIPFDDLPDRFVIKANHGSGWIVFVKDKQALDRQKVVRLCRKWLSLKYSKVAHGYETHYDSIPPLIIVERYIQEGGLDVPVDYKFFCFHRTVHLIQVNSGRFTRHYENYMDREWKDTGAMQPEWIELPRREVIPRPPRLAGMIQIAERLSGDLDFCRVDLYAPDPGRILFGEITLSPVGGLGRLVPRDWDFRLGELW